MKRRLNLLLSIVLGVLMGIGFLLPIQSAQAEPPVEEAPVDTSQGAAADDPEPVNPNARPVSAKTDRTRLDKASDPNALRLPDSVAGKHVQVATAPVTGSVSVAGATWDGNSADVTTYLRTVTDGRTTAWQEVDVEKSPEGRAGTAGVTLIGAQSVQVATVSTQNLNVTLSVVDPQAALSVKAAATGQPELPVIRTRADWGADESLVRSSPTYAQVKGVVVHHTEGANGYSAAQVPAIIRGTYAYHVVSRGWNDIGYNVLVDRFGVAWEGRRGGLHRAVQGAHATNFNHVSFGISLMGSYLTAIPSQEALDTISRVIAWKFNLHGVAAYGSYSNYGKTYPTITGHKDVQATDCPGTYLYSQLGSIRSRVSGLLDQYRTAPAVYVTANTAGSKPVGSSTNVWGTAAGGAGAAVAVEAWSGDRWTRSSTGMVQGNDTYVLPLSYGSNTAGTYRFRVAVTNGGRTYYSPEVRLTRTPLDTGITVTAYSAGTKPVAQGTNVWGSAPGAAGASALVEAFVGGNWSRSQVGTVRADGSYVLPLTYGSNSVGSYRFRVAVVTAKGTAYSTEVGLVRTPVVTAASAGSKPVGQQSFVWGSARGAAGSRVSVQAMVAGRWSTSQIGTVTSAGSYTLPLTYGSTTAGTYRFRVAVATSVGTFYSGEFVFTRI